MVSSLSQFWLKMTHAGRKKVNFEYFPFSVMKYNSLSVFLLSCWQVPSYVDPSLLGCIRNPWTGTSWRSLPTLALWQAPIPNQASLRPINFRLAGPSNCNFFHLWALLLLIFTPPPIIPHLSIPDRAKSVHLVVFADGSWPAEPTDSLIKMKDHALSWPSPTVSVCSLLGWGGRVVHVYSEEEGW